MNAISRCLFAIPVLLTAALLNACATLSPYKESPRVSLVSIKPLGMNVFEQRFGLQLRILNPNDTAIPVEGLSYAVEINDREFAYGVSRQAVEIPALGEALLDVEVISNTLNLVQQLQALQGQGGRLRYRVSGKIALANSPASLPFDYSGVLGYQPAATVTP